jgi:hypothetical protein
MQSKIQHAVLQVEEDEIQYKEISFDDQTLLKCTSRVIMQDGDELQSINN